MAAATAEPLKGWESTVDPHANDPSLDTRITSLQAMAEQAWAMARAAEMRAAEADTRAQQAQAAVRLKEIISEPQGPRHAAPRRDRSHLRLIQGGLAGLAPALVAIGLEPRIALAAAWRWVMRAASDHVRYVVAAVLLGAGGAVLPVVATMDPDPGQHLLVHHDHDAPPARVIPTVMAQSAHRHQPRRG